MNRSQTYGGRDMDKARAAKDAETMVGNGIATALAVTAGALAVIGLLVGFDIINNENPFENGLLWLASAITAAIGANVFRREHHILDEDEVRRTETRPMSGGSESDITRRGGSDTDVGARRSGPNV